MFNVCTGHGTKENTGTSEHAVYLELFAIVSHTLYALRHTFTAMITNPNAHGISMVLGGSKLRQNGNRRYSVSL